MVASGMQAKQGEFRMLAHRAEPISSGMGKSQRLPGLSVYHMAAYMSMVVVGM